MNREYVEDNSASPIDFQHHERSAFERRSREEEVLNVQNITGQKKFNANNDFSMLEGGGVKQTETRDEDESMFALDGNLNSAAEDALLEQHISKTIESLEMYGDVMSEDDAHKIGRVSSKQRPNNNNKSFSANMTDEEMLVADEDVNYVLKQKQDSLLARIDNEISFLSTPNANFTSTASATPPMISTKSSRTPSPTRPMRPTPTVNDNHNVSPTRSRSTSRQKTTTQRVLSSPTKQQQHQKEIELAKMNGKTNQKQQTVSNNNSNSPDKNNVFDDLIQQYYLMSDEREDNTSGVQLGGADSSNNYIVMNSDILKKGYLQQQSQLHGNEQQYNAPTILPSPPAAPPAQPMSVRSKVSSNKSSGTKKSRKSNRSTKDYKSSSSLGSDSSSSIGAAGGRQQRRSKTNSVSHNSNSASNRSLASNKSKRRRRGSGSNNNMSGGGGTGSDNNSRRSKGSRRSRRSKELNDQYLRGSARNNDHYHNLAYYDPRHSQYYKNPPPPPDKRDFLSSESEYYDKDTSKKRYHRLDKNNINKLQRHLSEDDYDTHNQSESHLIMASSCDYSSIEYGRNRRRYPKHDSDNYQESAVLTLLISFAQLIILILMQCLCGVAPTHVNPALGPYPNILSDWGGENAYLVLKDYDIWRFFTPILLHSGLLHFVVNVLIQLEIGTYFERRCGSAIWFLVYVISGVGASLVSYVLVPDGGVFVNSSGALMGLLGATFSDFLTSACFDLDEDASEEDDRQRRRASADHNTGTLLCCTFAIVLLGYMPYINWAGHCGGFVTGFLLASALILSTKSSNSSCRWGIVLFSFLLILALGFGFYYLGYYLFTEVEVDDNLNDLCTYYHNIFYDDGDYSCTCNNLSNSS